MDRTNKRIIISLIIFLTAFFGIIVYLTYFQLFLAKDIKNNPYNRRNRVDEENVIRGNIYDRNGVVLAETKVKGEEKTRIYPFGQRYSHVIGYTSKKYGKQGLESTFNDVLTGTDKDDYFKDIRKIFNDRAGKSLVLSIDNDLEGLIEKNFAKDKGAVIVMDNRTGEILAMHSNPGFNPSTIDQNWDDFVNSNNGELLNRAAQGLYQPGSTFKLVSAMAILKSKQDLNYTDTGKETVDSYIFKNSGGKKYGKIDLNTAMSNSINTYFINKIMNMDKDKFFDTIEEFYIDKDFDFDLVFAKSKFNRDAGKTEIASDAIGQGSILVSPLNMIMMTSAIAKEGVMIKPYIVKMVKDNKGTLLESTKSEIYKTISNKEDADKVKEAMIETAKRGTASSLQRKGFTIGAKTGTAELGKGKYNAWLVSFIQSDKLDYSICVVSEDQRKMGYQMQGIVKLINNYLIKNYNK